MKAEMTLDLENRHGHKTGGMNMKIKSLYFAACAAIAFVATSCVEENFKENKVGFTNDPSAVCFGVTSKSVESKTIYGEQDENKNWPLYWTAGDKIDIYCPQAEDVTSASYTVYNSVTIDDEGNVTTSDCQGTTNKGYINPSSDAYLKWGGSADPHDFFAAYPSGAVVRIDDNVVDGENVVRATFNVNNNQVCTIPADVTSGNYVAEPDMSNAYMVAYKGNVSPSVDAVSLDFKPIMTTLVVKVTAPTWAQNTTGYATVTGISIVTEVNSSDADAGKFVYDITNSTLVQNEVSGGTKTTHTTFVGVKHGDNHFVDLKSGETLTLTVFLPPIPINSENPIQVRLHVAGSDFIAHLGKDAPTTRPTNEVFANVSIPPSQMRRIVLPSLPDPLPDRSNWITPLDGGIILSQLSIPGTHDAAAYGEVGVEINLGLIKPTISIGKTQDYDLQQQWDMGIRAFDLRPALYKDTGELMIYHGVANCHVKFADILDMIVKELNSNPKELAIVITRHENDDVLGATFGKNTDGTSWSNAMAKLLEGYEEYMIEYKPDLTVDECRKHILFMFRDPVSYTKEDGSTYIPLGAKVGFDNGWNHNDNGGSGQMAPMRGGDPGALYVQDLYECINKKDQKLSIIYDYLDAAALLDNPSQPSAWYINHTSGYDSGLKVGSITIAGISTTAGYRSNAQNNNPNVYKYLVGTGTNAKGLYRTEQGPTGIVVMDFVGLRKSSNYEVYGDVLPQVIIDNNYKYRMKRKGE